MIFLLQKTVLFWFKCHWKFFPNVLLIIGQYWFRFGLGAISAPSHTLSELIKASLLMHISITWPRVILLNPSKYGCNHDCFTYILMPHKMIILYFHLPYFHVFSALFSTSVLSFCIDIFLTLSIIWVSKFQRHFSYKYFEHAQLNCMQKCYKVA